MHNSQAAASTYIQHISLNKRDTKIANDDAESCEHVYHVLEQPIGDNEYEELDKYEKKGRSQEMEEEVTYTVDGPGMEGKGPEGGASINDSASEKHDKSVLIL